MSGVPVLRGTRISVGQILAELAEGQTPQQVEESYGLKKNQVVSLLNDLASNMSSIIRAVQITNRLDRMDRWYGDTIVSGIGINLELEITDKKKLRNEYKPDVVSRPGDTILEICKERNMSLVQLATKMGVAEEILFGVIDAKIPIDRKISYGLARALGLPASFWMKRDAAYRKHLEENSE